MSWQLGWKKMLPCMYDECVLGTDVCSVWSVLSLSLGSLINKLSYFFALYFSNMFHYATQFDLNSARVRTSFPFLESKSHVCILLIPETKPRYMCLCSTFVRAQNSQNACIRYSFFVIHTSQLTWYRSDITFRSVLLVMMNIVAYDDEPKLCCNSDENGNCNGNDILKAA